MLTGQGKLFIGHQVDASYRSVAECRAYYRNAHQHHGHVWVDDYFRMDRSGYQIFVIPKTGIYKFTVYGAGHTGSYRAFGAKVETAFYLPKYTEGTQLVENQ